MDFLESGSELFADTRPNLAEEIDALARIGLDFGQRHNVPIAERLDYHRRKATVLSAIADRDGDPNTREVAELAWRHVRNLETEQADELKSEATP